MALDIVKLYISLISDFFKLSDMAVMASPSSNASTLPLLPANTHSLAIAHYLLRLLSEIQESVSELNGMEISSDASSSLKNLLESARWRFTDILVSAWLRDAQLFYYLEAWMPSPMDPSATHYLDQIELFQRQQTTTAFKLAGGIELSSYSLVKASKQLPIPQAFISKIVKAFMDALYAFLDGLVLQASDASPIATGKRLVSEAIPSIGANSLDLLDLTDSW